MILDETNWSHKAWMSHVDSDLVERVLLRLGSRSGPLDVLEWGTGKSTLYFTGLLAERGVRFRWLALEHDRAFFKELMQSKLEVRADARVHFSEKTDDLLGHTAFGVDVVVFDHGKLQPYVEEFAADRTVDMDAYVDLPARTMRTFDLILVDGRKRRRCVLEARVLLKPRGVVILHDSHRTYYHCAFDRFPSQRMVGELLWVGTNADTAHLDNLLEERL